MTRSDLMSIASAAVLTAAGAVLVGHLTFTAISLVGPNGTVAQMVPAVRNTPRDPAAPTQERQRS